MTITTGLSGNELFCLEKKGFSGGHIVLGNSVRALGFVGALSSSFKAILGGEIEQITNLIENGRERAYSRMMSEAEARGFDGGITGVTSQLIFHGPTIEFLSIGSMIHPMGNVNISKFSTASNGQELFAQLDAGYEPIGFAFGNTAYSIGITRGIMGSLKKFTRGEIKEFSDIFNYTRHLALNRIVTYSKNLGANAVLGITTSILPFGGLNEMLMIGTASRATQFPINKGVITSALSNIEMWNLTHMGYIPVRLLLGTSVYSLGFVGGITSLLKSFKQGEVSELTRLIYSARENALDIITREAKAIGADEVMGVKVYVYQLGKGLVEFLAIGTAVKKITGIKTYSEQLPVQAIVESKDSFYDATMTKGFNINVNAGDKPINSGSIIFPLIVIFLCILFVIIKSFK